MSKMIDILQSAVYTRRYKLKASAQYGMAVRTAFVFPALCILLSCQPHLRHVSPDELSLALTAPDRIPLQAGTNYRINFAATEIVDGIENEIQFDNWRRVLSLSGTKGYSTDTHNLNLTVTFSREKDYILAEGNITAKDEKDHAIILNYTLPVITPGDTFFASEINRDQAITANGEELKGWLLPIASLVHNQPGIGPVSGWGAALAIPPDAYADFMMTGSTDGLGVKYYLGLTSQNPTAHFQFIIYSIDPAWGFRSALNKYYRFFSSFYKPRTTDLRQGGLWLSPTDYFHLEGLDDTDSESLYPLYRFHEASAFEWWPQDNEGCQTKQDDLDRNQGYGIVTFPYVILGTVDTHPYEECSTVESGQTVWDCIVDRSMTSSNQRYKNRLHAVENSGRHDKNEDLDVWQIEEQGKPAFRTVANPDPNLFSDRAELYTMSDWVVDGQLNYMSFNSCQPWPDGVYFDSLSSPKWSFVMNYRKDHYPYSNYPLSIDRDGDLGLYNFTSHYEFLEQARRTTLDPLLFGNGIGRYLELVPTGYQLYSKNDAGGQFFLGAILDVGGKELGNEQIKDRRQRDYQRSVMGRKPILNSNSTQKGWEQQQDVFDTYNAALTHAIFQTYGSPDKSINYFLSNERELHAELTERFVCYARCLQWAGWQPVTHAIITDDNIEGLVLERYGSRLTPTSPVYFSLLNEGSETVRVDLVMDLQRFSTLNQGDVKIGQFKFMEDSVVTHACQADSENMPPQCELTMSLEPYKAQVLRLQSKKATSYGRPPASHQLLCPCNESLSRPGKERPQRVLN